MKAPLAASLLLLGLLLSGCLEQISTTRVPSGAARNFFYYLSMGEQQDAAAYWAPDYVPADSDQQISNAVQTLALYEFMLGKATTESDGAGQTVMVRGKSRLKGSTAWSDEIDLLRAQLIERGPGWRITSFTLVCCAADAPATTATPR